MNESIVLRSKLKQIQSNRISNESIMEVESIKQSCKQELQFGKGEAKAKSSRYKKNNMMMMMLTTMRSRRPRGRLVLMMMMMTITASTVLISGCSGKKLLRTGGRNNNSSNRKEIITSMRKDEEEEEKRDGGSRGSLRSQDDKKNDEAIEIENVDRTLGIFIDTDKSKSYFAAVPAPAPAPAVNENERKSSSEESSSHHQSEHEEENKSKSETYFINDYYIQSMSMMMILPTYKPTVKPTTNIPTTSAPYYNEPTYKPTTYKPTDDYQSPPPPTDHYYPEHENYYDDATTTTNKGNKNSNVIQKCDSSIADIICNTNGFHLLCEALTMVGYTEFLSTTNPNQLTLFAPTDDAFEKLALAFPSEWNNLNSNRMSNLLLFHLTDANNGVRFHELLCNEWLHMMNGDYTFTHCISGNSSNDDDEKYQIGRGNKDGRSAGDSNEISLKDSPLILQKDIVACNGIIHSTDTVMLPSSW